MANSTDLNQQHTAVAALEHEPKQGKKELHIKRPQHVSCQWQAYIFIPSGSKRN